MALGQGANPALAQSMTPEERARQLAMSQGIQLGGGQVPGLTGPAGPLATGLTQGSIGGTPNGVEHLGNRLLEGGWGQSQPAHQVGLGLAAGQMNNPAMGGAANFAQTGGGVNPAMAGAAALGRTGGGVNPAAAGAANFAQTGGGTNPAMRGYGQIAATGGGANPAMQGYAHFASGADVGGNPYLDDTYARASRPIVENFRDMGAPQMALDASSAGRSGGGLAMAIRNQAEGNVGRTLGDLSNQIYGGAYENERNRQMAGLAGQAQLGQQQVQNQLAGLGGQAQLGQQQQANQLAGLGLQNQIGQQQVGNQLAGLGMQGGFAQQQQANQLAGLGLQGSLGQQGIQNQMAGAQMLDAQRQQQLGNRLTGAGLLQQAGQQGINNQLAGAGLLNQGVQNSYQGIQLGAGLESQRYDDMQRLLNVGNALQQAPWAPAQQYLGTLGGMPGLGGGTTQTQPMYNNPMGNLLGMAGGIASIGNGFGLWGPQT